MSVIPGIHAVVNMPTKPTMTAVLSAISASNQVTFPGGIQARDIIVLWDVCGNSTIPAPSSVTPNGFTVIFDHDSGAMRGILSVKLADGSESGQLSGMGGTGGGPAFSTKQMYVFRGSPPAAAVFFHDVEGVGGGNPDPQVVDAIDPPAIVLGCYGSYGAIDPRSFTPAKDGEISGSTHGYLAYKIYNVEPTEDVTIDMDNEGTVNMLGSCYLQFV